MARDSILDDNNTAIRNDVKFAKRQPFLFQLSTALLQRDMKGAYRIYRALLKLLYADYAAPLQLSDNTTIWAPLDWPGIYRENFAESYEPDAIRLMAEAIESSEEPVCLIDCGADIGMFSRLLLTQTRNIGRLVAIEPNSRSFSILSKNISDLHIPADAIHGAVSDFSGYGHLTAPNHDSDAHAMFIQRSQAATDISVFSIDSLSLAPNRPIAIKIDVEGAEMNVIDGAATTLEQSSQFILQIEAHPEVCRRTNFDPSRILKTLARIRPIRCSACIEKTREITEVDDFSTPLFDQLGGTQIHDLVIVSDVRKN